MADDMVPNAAMGAINGLADNSPKGRVNASSASTDRALTDVIDQHLAWLGGRENLGEIRTLYMSGRLIAAGLEGTVTTQMMRPDRIHMQYELGPLRGTEVLDGETGWRLNETGQVEDLGDETRAGHEWSLDSAFALTLLGRTKRQVTLLPAEERDGKTWNVVRIGGTAGRSDDLFLDPQYGGLEWTRSIADGDTTWNQSDDWRATNGVRIPYHSMQLHENPAGNVEVEWTQLVVNAEIDPGLFERPTSSVRVGRIEGDAPSTGWIPMERYQERWIYLRGKLNGAETDLVLDSGAGMTVVDRSFAESIGIESSGALAASGVGGTDEAAVASSLSVDLGGLRFDGITAAILDLSSVARRLGRPIPVIFGKEAFHEFVVDVDYPNDRIAFHEPESFTYSGPGHTIDLISADGGHKLVMLSIEGLPETEFHLDTGSGGTVTLFPHYVDANHLLDGRKLSDTRLGGVGGDMTAKTGSLARVEIAGFELGDVPVTFFPGGDGAFDTQRQQGNLGAGILSRFRTIFDYGQARLILEPGKDWQREFRRDRIGITVDSGENGLVVTHVATGSPAAEAEIPLGMVLVSVNGEPLTGTGDVSPNERWWKIASGAEGGTVTFVDGDGAVHEIVRKRYS